MSSKLDLFTPEILATIQAEIIGLEQGHGVEHFCARCSPNIHLERLPALYRCLECFDHQPMCSNCIVERHHQLPFHHIQKWTGTYYDKSTSSLHDLGLVVYLGHGGSSCPMADSPPVKFVIVHSNGIHERLIDFCSCVPHEHSRIIQLIRNQLFPSSVETPRTAFTFHVLEDFHRHSLSAKTSAYDYYEALKRHSDAVFPQLIHVSPRANEALAVVFQVANIWFRIATLQCSSS